MLATTLRARLSEAVRAAGARRSSASRSSASSSSARRSSPSAISPARWPSISPRRCARRPARSPAELAAAVRPPGRRARGPRRGRGLPQFLPRPRARRPRAPRGPGRAAGRSPGKIIVEHTNINPNKAAHIGHLRNAVLGRRPRAGPAPPGPCGRGPELSRRHRRPGRRRRGGPHPPPGRDDRRGRATRHPRAAAFPAGRSSPRGSPTSAGTSTPRSAGPTRRGPRRRPGATRSSTRSRPATTRPRGSPPPSSEAVVVGAPRHDGPARHRLRPAAARERHPPQALLGAGLRAAQGGRRDPPRDRGQARRLLGAAADGVRGVRRHGGARQDPRPLQRHRDLHGQGHRLPALEVRPPADRLRLRAASAATGARARSGRRRSPARSATHPVWRTAHAGGAARRPRLRPRRRASTTSSTCASRTRRRSCGRACARSATPREADALDPLLLRDRGAVARRPRASSPSASARSTGSRPRTRRSRSSRCPAARASGSRPTTSSSCSSSARAPRSASRRGEDGAAPRRGRARRPGHRRRRAAVLPAEGGPQQGHRLRLRRGPQLRGRHRTVPPVLARARRQHLPQARGEGHGGRGRGPRR